MEMKRSLRIFFAHSNNIQKDTKKYVKKKKT